MWIDQFPAKRPHIMPADAHQDAPTLLTSCYHTASQQQDEKPQQWRFRERQCTASIHGYDYKNVDSVKLQPQGRNTQPLVLRSRDLPSAAFGVKVHDHHQPNIPDNVNQKNSNFNAMLDTVSSHRNRYGTTSVNGPRLFNEMPVTDGRYSPESRRLGLAKHARSTNPSQQVQCTSWASRASNRGCHPLWKTQVPATSSVSTCTTVMSEKKEPNRQYRCLALEILKLRVQHDRRMMMETFYRLRTSTLKKTKSLASLKPHARGHFAAVGGRDEEVAVRTNVTQSDGFNNKREMKKIRFKTDLTVSTTTMAIVALNCILSNGRSVRLAEQRRVAFLKWQILTLQGRQQEGTTKHLDNHLVSDFKRPSSFEAFQVERGCYFAKHALLRYAFRNCREFLPLLTQQAPCWQDIRPLVAEITEIAQKRLRLVSVSRSSSPFTPPTVTDLRSQDDTAQVPHRNVSPVEIKSDAHHTATWTNPLQNFTFPNFTESPQASTPQSNRPSFVKNLCPATLLTSKAATMTTFADFSVTPEAAESLVKKQNLFLSSKDAERLLPPTLPVVDRFTSLTPTKRPLWERTMSSTSVTHSYKHAPSPALELSQSRLREGDFFVKFNRKNGKPSWRYVWLDFSEGSLRWSATKPSVVTPTAQSSVVRQLSENNTVPTDVTFKRKTSQNLSRFFRLQKTHSSDAVLPLQYTKTAASPKDGSLCRTATVASAHTVCPRSDQTTTSWDNRTLFPSSSSFFSAFPRPSATGSKTFQQSVLLSSIIKVAYTWVQSPASSIRLFRKHAQHFPLPGRCLEELGVHTENLQRARATYNAQLPKTVYHRTFVLIISSNFKNAQQPVSNPQRIKEPPLSRMTRKLSRASFRSISPAPRHTNVSKTEYLQLTCASDTQLYFWLMGLHGLLVSLGTVAPSLHLPLFIQKEFHWEVRENKTDTYAHNEHADKRCVTARVAARLRWAKARRQIWALRTASE